MIDFLYANGCSWTAGNGIQDDPSLENLSLNDRWFYLRECAWPNVLATRFGVEHINEAVGAGSNARMVRTTCDFLRQYPKEKYKNLVVVLGWSTVDRNELYLKEKDNEGWCMFNATQPISSHSEMFRPTFSNEYLNRVDSWQKDYITDIYSHYANYSKFFQEMYLMSNLLENLGIKYLFFSSLPWRNKILSEFNITERFSNDISAVTKPNILNTRNVSEHLNVMSEFCRKNAIPMATDHHTMIQGHLKWADHLYQEFNNLYE